MATRSFIITANPKGDYTGVYCHWDGYPKHVGRILHDHYTKPGKVRDLIRGGSISVLDERIDPIEPAKHTFEEREPGTTLFYGRDRKEPWDSIKPVKADTLAELLKVADEYGCEYVYLYWNKHWSFADLGDAIDGKPFTQLTPETIAAYQQELAA